MSSKIVKNLLSIGFLFRISSAAFQPNLHLPFVPQQSDNNQDMIFEELFLNLLINPLSTRLDESGILKLNFNPENEVTFYLYTRDNPSNGYKLKVGDSMNLQLSPLKSENKIKIIIHGWTDSSSKTWLSNFRNNYLSREDYNVIIVDWYPASMKDYPTAVKLVHPIGQYVSELVNFMRTEKNISLKNVHLLGHSLGAHMAGFCGYFLSGKIGRITGMDPARPGFEIPILRDQKERLDPSDAKFVDVIHTCAGTVGFFQACGHVDFFPNGGTFRQPGCSPLVTQYCSHARSYQFMAESIIYPEVFVAVKCDSWNEFKAGKCVNESRILMGENVDFDSRGLYFLETRDSSPFGLGI